VGKLLIMIDVIGDTVLLILLILL